MVTIWLGSVHIQCSVKVQEKIVFIVMKKGNGYCWSHALKTDIRVSIYHNNLPC